MSELFMLSKAQMRRIEPYFPLSHGVPRVDDQRILSGIIFVIKNGLRWRDAPAAYGPHKTIYNRFVRGSRLGVSNKIFATLAAVSDSDEYRAALKAEGSSPCIPSRKGHRLPVSFDKSLYRQRHQVENMFGKRKDWRRIHTRYDRCAHQPSQSLQPSSSGSVNEG